MPVTPVSPWPRRSRARRTTASQPITWKRGSSVSGSMRTRSIAPGAARWPQLIWAPSKAGPVGLDAARSRSRSPSTISAFVPTSTTSCIVVRAVRPLGRGSRRRCRRRRGRRCTAARRRARRGARRARGPPAVHAHRLVGRERERAPPSGVGSMPSRRWCMIGLPTSTISSTSSRGDAGRRRASSAISFASASRTARVSSVSARGSSSRTRRGSSGPRRSGSAGSSPGRGEHRRRRRGRRGARRSSSSRCRPRSRRRVSWKPGQTAVIAARRARRP